MIKDLNEKGHSSRKPEQHGDALLVLGDCVTGLASAILTERHKVLLRLHIQHELLATAVA